MLRSHHSPDVPIGSGGFLAQCRQLWRIAVNISHLPTQIARRDPVARVRPAQDATRAVQSMVAAHEAERTPSTGRLSPTTLIAAAA